MRAQVSSCGHFIRCRVPVRLGHETWEGESWRNRSGVNVWTFLVLDEARGIVYLPFAAPTFDRWGGDRKGANLFGNSIVAVEAATGKYLWHFQTVHHDIWDLDLPAATLVDVKRDGKTIPAIAVMNKSGAAVPARPRHRQAALRSQGSPGPNRHGHSGRITLADAADARGTASARAPVEFKMDDLANLTPEHRAFCERLIKEKNIVESRMFQPLRGDSAVASFPGSLGGIDWGGGAFDPQLGYLHRQHQRSREPAATRPASRRLVGIEGRICLFLGSANRLPCQQPPWGSLMPSTSIPARSHGARPGRQRQLA